MFKYSHAILGGTFDHLHKGHRKFLTEAFMNSERVTVGLASSELFQKKILPRSIQTYKARLEALTKFLKEKDFLPRANIIELDDIYGNALTESAIDAIFVTEHGKSNAKKINAERVRLNWNPLEIVEVTFELGSDSEVIASTSIRRGISDREGMAYKDYFNKDSDLLMPTYLRNELQNPLGKIIKNNEELNLETDKFVVAVGDATVSRLKRSNKIADISIFDYKTKRSDIESHVLAALPSVDRSFKNESGTISGTAALGVGDAILQSVKNGEKLGIKIDGEEDLLALPAILFAPLNSVVVYGLRDQGVVAVKVDEFEKERVLTDFLEKFKRVKSSS